MVDSGEQFITALTAMGLNLEKIHTILKIYQNQTRCFANHGAMITNLKWWGMITNELRKIFGSTNNKKELKNGQ